MLEAIARIAEKYHLVVLADEIYDQMTYDDAEFVPMATLVHQTLCGTLSGLSKVYRACGYRVGWAVFSGDVEHARDYLSALELLSSLRLCSNVPGQWAVQTALGGYQSIRELLTPGGRLYESRKAILEAVQRSRYLHLAPPMGAMYAFVGVQTDVLPEFDDQQFALDLLEHKHVLVAPGSSFNVPVPQPLPDHQPARSAGASARSSPASRNCSATTRPATSRRRGRTRRCEWSTLSPHS